jgi:hypothetical protein
MRAAKRQEDDNKNSAISVYVPRVSVSPRLAADSAFWRIADEAAAPKRALLDHADHCSVTAPATGIAAKLLEHNFIHTSDATAKDLCQPTVVPSPPSHISPRRSPTRSPPSRDNFGAAHKPPYQPQTQSPPSDVLVHRLKSFLPSATRPLTRQCRTAADIATEAVKMTCNGPALDRFPLSIQGGLSSHQVKRAHTPAYEPRISGHEREPLKQTWLVPNPRAESASHALPALPARCPRAARALPALPALAMFRRVTQL